jgi:hypothetical protein
MNVIRGKAFHRVFGVGEVAIVEVSGLTPEVTGRAFNVSSL